MLIMLETHLDIHFGVMGFQVSLENQTHNSIDFIDDEKHSKFHQNLFKGAVILKQNLDRSPNDDQGDIELYRQNQFVEARCRLV